MTRVGLVLGAGGTPGYAWDVAVLAALGQATGYDWRESDVVVGTSAGSLVGSFLRAGISAPDLAAGLVGAPISPAGQKLFDTAGSDSGLGPFSRSEMRLRPAAPGVLLRAVRHPGQVRPGTLLASLGPAGAVDGRGVGTRQRRLFGDTWPDRELQLCAVDLATSRRVAFGAPGAPQTDVATAVAASCAVPGYLRPVRVGGHDHIDGGAWSTTNADLLVGRGLDLVVVLVPMGMQPGLAWQGRETVPRRFCTRQALAEARRLTRAGTPTVVLAPSAEDLKTLTLAVGGGRAKQIVAAATATMLARYADPDRPLQPLTTLAT